MSQIVVSNTQELHRAIQNARGGDTIALASGNYSGVKLGDVHFKEAVTLTSLDPGDRAVLSDLMILRSSGIRVAGLDLHAATAQDYVFVTTKSKDVSFDNIDVRGPSGNGAMTSAPFMIRESDGATVTNSSFEHAWIGIQLLETRNVTVSGSVFRDLSMDGVRGGGNSDLTISGNYFTDFHPIDDAHRDAIQLWTTNTTTSAKNITITGNIITRGDGAPVQGVFMRDEAGNLPYRTVTISDNLIIGGMFNGIAVGSVRKASITNNTVIGLPDQKSWITVTGESVSLTGNKAAIYTVNGNTNTHKNGTTPPGNAVIDVPTDNGHALLQGWLDKHPAMAALLDHDSGTTILHGTDGADRLTATASGRVEGGAGDDTLTGAANGWNILDGGTGNDIYVVRSANHTVAEHADGGNDLVQAYVDHELSQYVEQLRMMQSDLVGRGNDGANRMVGSNGRDTLHGNGGDDTLLGQDGNDLLYGGAGDDQLAGADGNDLLDGGAGADTLLGGAGVDQLNGGAGDDILESGTGADSLTGGAGADQFRFRPGDTGASVAEADRITDFSRGEGDRILLSFIDANSRTPGDNAFTFIGKDAFHGVAGELRYEVKGGIAHVLGDTNGDGVADLRILLDGVNHLIAADFQL